MHPAARSSDGPCNIFHPTWWLKLTFMWQHKSRICTRVVASFWLPISYWQRICDSEGLTSGFRPPTSPVETFPHLSYPPVPDAMAVLDALEWANFSQPSDEATSTEGKRARLACRALMEARPGCPSTHFANARAKLVRSPWRRMN